MNFNPKLENYKFKKLSIDSFIEKQNKSGKNIDTKQLKKDLTYFQQLKNQGIKCDCGNDLWVIGSAISGKGCFTCITMETDCSNDYEIE